MRFKDDLQKYIYYTSQIDYCYWRIEELSDIKDKDKEADKLNELIYLVGVIVRCKPKLGYDAKEDRKFLNELKKQKKNSPAIVD